MHACMSQSRRLMKFQGLLCLFCFVLLFFKTFFWQSSAHHFFFFFVCFVFMGVFFVLFCCFLKLFFGKVVLITSSSSLYVLCLWVCFLFFFVANWCSSLLLLLCMFLCYGCFFSKWSSSLLCMHVFVLWVFFFSKWSSSLLLLCMYVFVLWVWPTCLFFWVGERERETERQRERGEREEIVGQKSTICGCVFYAARSPSKYNNLTKALCFRRGLHYSSSCSICNQKGCLSLLSLSYFVFWVFLESLLALARQKT